MSPALALYRSVWELALALNLPAIVLRGRPEELAERLGRGPQVPPGAVWVHAASMGEMVAAASLVRALRATGDLQIALTAMTRTGRERASRIGPDLGPMHIPLDAPGPVGDFLDRVRPRALIILETELWPNLLRELHRRGVPWAMASARLTERSLKRLGPVRRAFGGLVSGAAAIAARTDADAERFLRLGVPAAAVRVTGDLKEDREVPDWAAPPGDFPRWIAACTRPGEEEDALSALEEIRRDVPAGELVLAPRHPERFDEVASLVARAGLPLRRWAERDESGPAAGWSVLLVDEMGVLDEAYARAECAFVGGSLQPFGGHSPLEAAVAGRPVLVGPHTKHCRDAVERLESAGGLIRVRSSGELARRVSGWLLDPESARAAGRSAQAAARTSAGAAAATIAFLRERGVLP